MKGKLNIMCHFIMYILQEYFRSVTIFWLKCHGCVMTTLKLQFYFESDTKGIFLAALIYHSNLFLSGNFIRYCICNYYIACKMLLAVTIPQCNYTRHTQIIPLWRVFIQTLVSASYSRQEPRRFKLLVSVSSRLML
jgi:hypothetical protein